MQLAAIREARAAKVAEARRILATAETEKRSLNPAEQSAFDKFKGETDSIAIELNAALNAVLTGIAGMDRSFQEGDQQMADETRSTEGATAFDAARFGSVKA